MDANKPLDGITVVELGHSVAAPYAGMILADLGARVIKVENPGKGDYARGWGPPFWGETASAFAALNRGKEGITINLADPVDAARLRRLIAEEADGVIQNLRPGTLERHGFDVAAMLRDKPSLVWCDLGAFGSVGPLAAKPGYDPLAQATSGIMSVTGEAGRPPVRVGVSLIDMGSGMWSVIGMLAAFFARERSGEGARVSTSLFETGLAWMTLPLAGYEADGEVRRPYGSGAAEICPYQAFQTRGGWMMIAAGNDALFAKLCRVLGLDLAEDPRFLTNADRVRNREILVPLVAEAVAAQEFDALAGALDAVGVPNAPLLSVDAVARHQQTEALQMAVEADGLRLMGVPLTMDGARPRATKPAPALGEHDERIKA
ncbi:CaiB/BaiF CoA transferase family protein [Acuticoccus mangrovi]|uniref:CoA transferase n=1 Tax=Acuticoccus mangrovi TaxID=2796142 RepID=A0A934MF49_9HYPH|nr:CoA transferase [Acuticoccus mangrovi]MBJ3774550.1 CoA transferase [Acuticoccus mangrovi]